MYTYARHVYIYMQHCFIHVCYGMCMKAHTFTYNAGMIAAYMCATVNTHTHTHIRTTQAELLYTRDLWHMPEHTHTHTHTHTTQAELLYTRVLGLNPMHVNSLFNIAALRFHSGKYTECLTAYRRILMVFTCLCVCM